ncbi:rhamnogalacturonan acetylesterase [Pinibacter soli]|uniref:Rhamnogalacturonan acetylesterase n=1 Tax=Pinibacter soli TaxID=3044211 RepID=A0ABT6RBJ8_9BACT|nr:rhamnogalacturonan acetylesterase [Pinibacter soli]MDI3319277.1 rhamnogalacturonan acetylesterase [Pinibacter soli]
MKISESRRRYFLNVLWLPVLVLFLTAFSLLQSKPVLYIIGDSTVRNQITNGQWGWGSLVGDYFDSIKIDISNQAMAGRSTRTFIKEGRWDKVLSTLKAGDFVIMQFGHNEGAKPDTSREGYRGVLSGTGDETISLTWKDSTKEVVHTYGWYIKKFVNDAKAKGATVIVASMIPRNIFKDGKVVRADNNFGKWAAEAANASGAYFINLNAITADKYDAMGPELVKTFFPGDHTHTNKEGAAINAASVVEGLRKIKDCSLNNYLK